jgi:hypothetical protein
MAWTTPSLADIASGQPVTTDWGALVVNDLLYLKAQTDSSLSISFQSVFDDFYARLAADATTLDPNGWIASWNGVTPDLITPHQVRQRLSASSAGASVLFSTKYKMRVDLTRDTVWICEFRAKNVAAGSLNLFFGLNDDALTDPPAGATTRANVDAIVTTVADCLGFVYGTGGKWKFRTSKGGTASTTDSLGTLNAYSIMNMTITGSSTPANRKVDVTVDGTTISGSPFTSNIPDSKILRLVFGMDTASGADPAFETDLDYVLLYPTTRPLS